MELMRALKKDESQQFVNFILEMREKTNKLLVEHGQKVRITVEKEIERLESGDVSADYDGASTSFRIFQRYSSEFNQPDPQRPDWLKSY